MKLIYLTTLLMLFATCMYAQFNAGDKVLGGSFSLNSSSNDDNIFKNRSFGFSFLPRMQHSDQPQPL